MARRQVELRKKGCPAHLDVSFAHLLTVNQPECVNGNQREVDHPPEQRVSMTIPTKLGGSPVRKPGLLPSHFLIARRASMTAERHILDELWHLCVERRNYGMASEVFCFAKDRGIKVGPPVPAGEAERENETRRDALTGRASSNESLARTTDCESPGRLKGLKPQPVVGKGLKAAWVLVPREPTEEMISKALASTATWKDIPGSALTVNREKMRLRWRARLAAIPASPAGEAERTCTYCADYIKPRHDCPECGGTGIPSPSVSPAETPEQQNEWWKKQPDMIFVSITPAGEAERETWFEEIKRKQKEASAASHARTEGDCCLTPELLARLRS